MTTQVNSNLDVARAEFFAWNKEVGNRHGKGDYEVVAGKVAELAANLPTIDMTLKCEDYSFGFSFCYGVVSGVKKFIPLSFNEKITLEYQLENEGGKVRWPLKNPETGAYFIPRVTEETVKHPSQDRPTDIYIREVLDVAERDKESTEYRILESLAPHAFMIEQCCGVNTYGKIRQLFPDSGYPEKPISFT